jgi:hypothetical protein
MSLIFKISRGVVAISISLNNFDLKQCGVSHENETETEHNSENLFSDSSSRDHDPFYDTDMCDRDTTQVKLNRQSFYNRSLLFIIV